MSLDSRQKRRGKARRAKQRIPVGTIIGKYRIEEVLGAGSFGSVYRAQHLLLDAPFALKVLHSEVVRRSSRFVDQLCAEARYMARLNHPNVVRVVDLHRGDGLDFIVQEYVEGESLANKLKRQGPLSVADCLRVGIDVASGLEAALAHGIVHRDIKPGNILVTHLGQAKVIDLGLAYTHLVRDDSRSHQGRSFVGTPAYMAPEQAEGANQVDHRADVYALGMTLWHAIVGHPPFRGSRKNVIEEKRTKPPPYASSHVSLPRELDQLLHEMMQPDPTDRPGDYGEINERFRTVLHSSNQG